jgi:hypothetical protein
LKCVITCNDEAITNINGEKKSKRQETRLRKNRIRTYWQVDDVFLYMH